MTQVRYNHVGLPSYMSLSGGAYVHNTYTAGGARMYSPSNMRWLTMDPLCEKYYSISPYAYCAGDPVNLVDPDGRIFDTFIDVASLATGVKSFVSIVKKGKVGAAIVDGIGIVADATKGASRVTDMRRGIAKETQTLEKLGEKIIPRVLQYNWMMVLLKQPFPMLITRQ